MNPAPDAPLNSGLPSAACRAMIERLIGFNTVSRDSNLGLIEWVRDYLQGLGAATRLTHDPTGKKANLFATLGDSKKPGLILSGHTDVVPVDGQDWHTDPFQAIEQDGKLYARGSADMKGFIGIALAKAPKFIAALQRQSPRCAAALFAELRRGGRLHRRARTDSRPGGEPYPPGGLCRGRTHLDAAHHCAQGHASLPLRGAWTRGALQLCHAWRERHRVRGTPGGVHSADRRPPGAERSARLRIHRAVFHPLDRRDSRRHCRQCRAQGLRVSIRHAHFAAYLARGPVPGNSRPCAGSSRAKCRRWTRPPASIWSG